MNAVNEISNEYDVVIAGCGVAGLYTALHLPPSMRVLMLSKGPFDHCDSMLAQGGICVLLDGQDYHSFYEDTMAAGHYENRAESVDIMIRESRQTFDDLVKRGVRFARQADGALEYTREGGHSKPRICHYGDSTGREITSTLQRLVRELPNVEMREYTQAVDLLVEDGMCVGLLVQACKPGEANEALAAADREPFAIRARYTVLACGGIGGLYQHSTNYPEMTGDACRMAQAHGVALEHMDYVQIHPTSLYTGRSGRAFLISESARGEGAVLLDARGNRFTDELRPRDVVSQAIFAQMEAEGSAHVWLSFRDVPEDVVRGHFAGIYQKCLEEGYDILKEPIPVVPAQHYFMGGIWVDAFSRTTMARLFAVGETSCNGVHGKNRLASNSLLESLVFSRRAAQAIVEMETQEGLPWPVCQA